MDLSEKLSVVDRDIKDIILTLANGTQEVTKLLHTANRAEAGTVNASGETQLAMDIQADNIFFNLFKEKNNVKEFASEEREGATVINEQAQYSITIDPLDGSSLLDVNLSVGTILGIWKGKVLEGEIVGAAYVVYGPTTTFILSTGQGVNEFILRNNNFDYLQEIKVAEKGKIYSTGGLRSKWVDGHSDYINALEEGGYKLRYSGGLVPDVNQILLKKGGVFTYPALVDKPNGKLRLMFELCPFAFLAEQAGGAASNGCKRILEIERKELHQRSAIYIGSKKEIEQAESFLKDNGGINMMTESDVKVPADVPAEMKSTYIKNYLDATKRRGRLFLYAGDQKIEHLNDDFYGQISTGAIPIDDADPEHLFKIGKEAKQHIGFFAAQYGLIARYGKSYPEVPYLVKMNSKSHLVKTKDRDPISTQLVSFDDVLALKNNSGLNVVGVGYTIYVGSKYECEMLAEAGKLVADAHKNGMLIVLWVYPRGKAVTDEKDPHIIAGGAGVACCLGADFVKVNYPKKEGSASEEVFKEAVLAAGRTGVITSGGSSTDVRAFLDRLHKQVHISGCVGNATGRNIHQKTLHDAVKMCAAVAAVTYGNKDPDFAMKIYNGEEVFQL